MSEETSQVEQITREPSVKTKVKDPKRVKAGKTLSEKNKRATEALKREEEREKKEKVAVEATAAADAGDGGGWIPKNIFSPQNIIAIGATVGVAVYGLWTNYRDRIPDLHFSTIFKPSPQPKVTESQPVASTTEETDLKDDLL